MAAESAAFCIARSVRYQLTTSIPRPTIATTTIARIPSTRTMAPPSSDQKDDILDRKPGRLVR
jgi:hypothetical protein